MKPLGRFILLAVLFTAGNLFAATTGNLPSREIADVVFRSLDMPIGRLETHSAIYVGNTCKTCGDPSLSYYHKVIEMIGFKKTTILGKVTEVNGIDFTNLYSFEHAHPAYYGAFMHPNNPDIETRKNILKKAQYLMTIDPPIKYIVIPGDWASDLLTSYFSYGNNNTGPVTDENINRMRSDAFVEYCYASALVPIMPNNITTANGAFALISQAGMQVLYPADQQDQMTAAQVDNPTLEVREQPTDEIVTVTASTTNLKFNLYDNKSGPGMLEVDGYGVNSKQIQKPIDLLKSGMIQLENIQRSVPFNLSSVDGISKRTFYTARVYDHAGNSSDFSFKVAGDPGVYVYSSIPMYYDFQGVSASNPSTMDLGHSFIFSDEIAGISSVDIDGPNGSVYSRTFDPPVFPSTYTALGDMAIGQYQIKTVNSAGNQTIAPFQITEMGVQVSTHASRSDIAYSAGSLTTATVNITLTASATSYIELERAELITDDGDVVGSKPLSGTNSTFSLALPQFNTSSPPFMRFSSTAPYIGHTIKVYDIDGNSKQTNVHNSYSPSSTLFFPTHEFSSTGQYETETKNMEQAASEGVSVYLRGGLISDYFISESPDGTKTLGKNSPSIGAIFYDSPGPTGPLGTEQDLGTISISVITGDQPDLSDGVTTVFDTGRLYVRAYYGGDELCEVGGGVQWLTWYNGIGACLDWNTTTPHIVTAKQYIKARLDFTAASPATIMYCKTNDLDVCYANHPGNPAACPPQATYCLESYKPAVYFAQGINYSGFTFNTYPAYHGNAIEKGTNVSAVIEPGVSIKFDRVTAAGSMSASITNKNAPAGFTALPANIVFNLASNDTLIFSGGAELTFKYNASNLTPEQEGMIKILKVIDPDTGKYDELPTSRDMANKEVSANVTSFGDFIVAVPEYANPQNTQSANMVNGKSELEFLSGITATLTPYDINNEAGQNTLAAVKSADKLPVTNVYRVSADTTTLVPSGAITMRYSADAPATLGVSEDSLAIYGIAEAGDLYKLPYLTLDKVNKVLTAKTSTLYPLYSVLASSIQVENIPPSVYPDGIPPVTTLSYSALPHPVSDGVFISSHTSIILTAADPQIPDVVTSGFNLTNYLLDSDLDTVSISTFTGPFPLNEGVHPVYYFSLDNAGNYEFPKGTTIYVDATPPNTEISVIGPSTKIDGSLFISAISSIALSAFDPQSHGIASGPGGTYYLVDTDFPDCPDLLQLLYNPSGQPPGFNGTPGTCGNPIYSGPFILPDGPHTIYFASVDNVRNFQVIKSTIIYKDGTAPQIKLKAAEVFVENGGTVNIVETDSITLLAIDPPSNGAMSGVATNYVFINISPNECVDGGQGGGFNGFGGCENPYYPGPFVLAPGTYTVSYFATDRAGNQSHIRSANIAVSPGDIVPPVTTAWIKGQAIPDGATSYITASDTITLTAVDAGSGVKSTYYAVDTVFSTNTAIVYTVPFSLSAGTHTIYYLSMDNAGNPERIKRFCVEITPDIVFGGVAQSSAAILWTWNAVPGADNYRIISDSGGAISPVLASGVTVFLQGSLAPNMVYCARLTAHMASGAAFESALSGAATFAAAPGASEVFNMGQNASLVIGQQNYVTTSGGTTPNKLYYPAAIYFDSDGDMWVSDRQNNRVLRFDPPFTSGMNASLVIGQQDFYSNSYAISASKFYSPLGLARDADGNLWVFGGGSKFIPSSIIETSHRA